MKLKYFLTSNKIMLVIFTAVMVTLLFIQATFGIQADPNQTVINDNSTAVYKTIKLSSDLCINVLTNCKHEVYVNGLFSGYFREGDVLQVPDGSDVVIVLEDPINTNLEKSYDTGKSLFAIAIMYLIGPIIVILVVYLLIMFSIGRFRWKRWRRW